MNACCIGCSVPSEEASPSIVVMSPPSAWAASIVQLFTDSPLKWIVQAPHEEVSQPMFVPVSPTFSRMYWTSSVRGSTSWVCWTPLTVTLTCPSGPPCSVADAVGDRSRSRDGMSHLGNGGGSLHGPGQKCPQQDLQVALEQVVGGTN